MSVVGIVVVILCMAIGAACYVDTLRNDPDLTEHLAWLAALRKGEPIQWPDDDERTL